MAMTIHAVSSGLDDKAIAGKGSRMVPPEKMIPVVIFLLLAGWGSSAQARESIVVDRAVLKIAENTGLVIQDQDGFLWFGTNGSGLFRYDGIALKAFKTGPGSISDNYIFALYEDSEGLIWIGTRNGLNKYDKLTHTFTVYRYDPDDQNSVSHDAFAWGSRSIWEDASGDIWIGTMKGPNRFSFRKTPHPSAPIP